MATLGNSLNEQLKSQGTDALRNGANSALESVKSKIPDWLYDTGADFMQNFARLDLSNIIRIAAIIIMIWLGLKVLKGLGKTLVWVAIGIVVFSYFFL